MITLSVRDIDRGQKKLLAQVAKMAGGAAVKVGIQGKSVSRTEGDVDNVQLGIIHEFGTHDGTIPERSFLRSTFDENEQRYFQNKAKLAGQILDGRMDIPKALGILGERVVADVRAKIVAHIPPPDAPATVAAKGSSTPLVDTGQLLRSIHYEVTTGKEEP